MINLMQNKGITLITLMLAIVIMIIISSVILYNARTGINTRELNNMYNDIVILKNKVDVYYSQYGTLPIIKKQYTNIENIKSININDNNYYYVVDLEALENITLTYGKDYNDYKQTQNDEKTDIYIINEQSHTIYYVAGVRLDKKTYYTTVSDYTKLEISTKCNSPKLGTGMKPVKWNGTQFIETKEYDVEWYDYIDTSLAPEKKSESKWANAQTEDGSMWVWIPRFAYKIIYADENDKLQSGTIDIVFLKNDTNYDFNGEDVTNANYTDAQGKVGAYIVHPAFQDGAEKGFSNGEWNKEITGFWIAKFEAGYADRSLAQDSNVSITVNNYESNYYGSRKKGDLIKYPVFQGNKPSMNYLGISDVFDLCKDLTKGKNPYGLTNSVDSHLTKNSEWGAVAYLTHSKYGRNGNEITINNVVNANGENTIYTVTGYGAKETNAQEDTSRNLETLITIGQEGSWTTQQGQTASSTGNIYGIYDLSGGLWEWTAGYIATNGNYEIYGGSLKGESSPYKSKYVGTNNDGKINYNEIANKSRIGEAIWETSFSGVNSTSWNGDYSSFLHREYPFSTRGGNSSNASKTGVFSYSAFCGDCDFSVGFRTVLVTQ